MDRIGPKQTEVDRIDRRRPNGPNWTEQTEMDRNRPNWTELN